MKRNITKIFAALALLVTLAIPMGMMGQTRDVQQLTNANIVAAGNAITSYQSWTIIDGNNHTWNAYAIKNKHSNATASYHYLQIKKYASNTAYYIQVPELGTQITSITMTVSSTSKPMDGGENTATLYFSNSNSTSSTGTGVASGFGESSVTINCSSLNLNTGYITASGAVRIWDVSVTYSAGGGDTPTHAYTLNVTGADNNAEAAVIVNGEELGADDEIAEGETVTVSVTPSNGYTYSVAVVDANDDPVEYDDENDSFTMPTSDVTITVNTTLIPTYTVTFNTNGGTFVGNQDFPELSNTKQAGNYTLPSATKTGSVFVGWLATGSTDVVSGSYEVSGNVDFTAQWIQGVVDVLNREFTGIGDGANYGDWSGKVGTSGAVYAGQSAGANNAIQLRSNNNNSGIVTTTSGGTVKKVTVVWEDNTQSGRTLNVYGSNTAYTNATDLYDEDTDGDLLGTIVYGTSTELVISGDYAYIGLRSESGAMYLSEIRITWESLDTPSITVTPLSLNTFLNTSLEASAPQEVQVLGVNLTDDINVTVNNSNFEISQAENSGYTNSITLAQTNGSVASTTIYVRMKSGLSVGAHSGNLSITSTDASQVEVALSGNVVATMTVAEAIEAIDEATGNIVSGACVQGVVSYVEYYSSTNHYITYYISVDGSRDNELEVFHGKNINGTDFTSNGDLLVGDQVVVCGNLKLYNSTHEFDEGNRLISLNRPEAQEYTLAVSNLSNVNIFVFDAENQSEPLFEGEGSAQVYNGTSVLLSVEFDENYALQSLIVDGVNVASQLDESGAYTFYMPTRNVTITATAEVLPAVILCDDNTTLYGATVTLPTRGNSGDYTFAGWCVTNYETETTTTPTIIPAGAYQTTQQSIVLYPVYTRTEGGSGTEWHLVTDLTTVGAGVYALLTNNNYAFNGNISKGHGQSTAAAFEFDGNGVATSAPSGTLEITFELVDGGFTMYAENKGYLYAKGAGSGNLDWHNSESNYWYVNESFIYNEEYTVNNQPAYAHLRVYDNTFRTYQINSQHNIQLAQKVGGASGTTYYTSLLSSYSLPITAYSGEKDHYYLISSPMVGGSNPMSVQNLLDNDYDLYRFDQTEADEWRNYKQGSFNLVSGHGYLYANSGNGTDPTVTLTFTGTPYSGNGEVTLINNVGENTTTHFGGWNLIGNPYPTAATLKNANGTTNRDYYEMNSTGTEIIAGTAGTPIDAMNGVFVKAANDGEVVKFITSSGSKSKQICLNLSQTSRGGNALIDRAIVRFDEGDMLPKFQLNPDHTKVYIPQNDRDYAVVRSASEGEMPVSFKAETNGTYTLSTDITELEVTYLHLIDNLTGTDVDLLATPSYTFNANTTDYASRFKLVFKAGTGIDENTTTDTFAFFNGSEWTVSNQGNATLQVVDMLGRIVNTQTINGNATININETPGIYMLRLVNGNNVMIQKIVVR